MDLKTAYDAYLYVAAKYPGKSFAGGIAVENALQELLAAVKDSLDAPDVTPAPQPVAAAPAASQLS